MPSRYPNEMLDYMEKQSEESLIKLARWMANVSARNIIRLNKAHLVMMNYVKTYLNFT